jgi:glutamine amidotransferase
VFAHNGDLQTLPPLEGEHRPIGQTDSETAFCWILEELERRSVSPDDEADLFEALVACSDRLAGEGIFNGLLSNGAWLFAYAGTKLHRVTRRAPFGRVRLADDDLSVDFAAVTQPSDVVTILSTEPLTAEESWQPLQVGEAILLKGGEIVRQRPAQGSACLPR